MADTGGGIRQKMDAQAQEAYKVLRTNIQFCEYDRKIKTIAITSSLPGEGKTTTSINLGISMAESDMKTLFVDADLRKPMLMKNLKSPNLKGLSNLISGTATSEDVINSTGIKNFHYITCGVRPPNPAELIGSAKFREFLNSARDWFDVVIIDTPPLGSVIDCAIISAQADGTILVIQPNEVDYHAAQRVKEQLEKANARILGVVLNKVPRSDCRDRYNYYDFYGNRRPLDKKWLKERKGSRSVRR